MSCIWSGHIEHILKAVEVRSIADRLMFWALRIFKPWVTECLDYWYQENKNRYYFTYSNCVKDEMLTSLVREDKSTQTLDNDKSSPIYRGLRNVSKNRFGRRFSNESNTTDGGHSRSSSVPAADRSNSSGSEYESLPHAGSRSEPDRSHQPRSSRTNLVGHESDGESAIILNETSDQSKSELDHRLRDVRARVKEASLRSLILTNRVSFLVQRIRLEQIRSQGMESGL